MTKIASIDEWKRLPEFTMPRIKSAAERGRVVDVQRVGALIGVGLVMPTVLVREDGGDVLYRLPESLAKWALDCLFLASTGPTIFPSKVEFGVLDGRGYAEIL